jgi:heat shock protein HspQ
VGLTEKYWCPIKHARRRLHAHPYYHGFTDFGDAENYRTELSRLRADLMKLPQDQAKDHPKDMP